MLSPGQRARLRSLARVCAEKGEYGALVAYVESLMVSPTFARKPPPIPLGYWDRIKGWLG